MFRYQRQTLKGICVRTPVVSQGCRVSFFSRLGLTSPSPLLLSQRSAHVAGETPSRVSFTNDVDNKRQQLQQQRKSVPSESRGPSPPGASETSPVHESSPAWAGNGGDHSLISIASGASASTPMSTGTPHLLSLTHDDSKDHGGGLVVGGSGSSVTLHNLERGPLSFFEERIKPHSSSGNRAHSPPATIASERVHATHC